jgi:hypothetical protein
LIQYSCNVATSPQRKGIPMENTRATQPYQGNL